LDVLESHIIDIAMTAMGSAVFGLVGFVWKISHKASVLEKKIDGLRDLQTSDSRQFRKDIDYILNKVDNHGDKMYSIVKNLKD
tara:strand:- start:278 stop:526 length:249 start_codon:yes stop_codon:yes gene_type:complete